MILNLIRIIPLKYLASGIGVIAFLIALYFAVNNHCDKRLERVEIESLKAQNEALRDSISKERKLKSDVKKVIKNGTDILPDDLINVLDCLQSQREGKPCKARDTTGADSQ